mmetsp:Transcript_44769/g.51483  ORF Transcript_44769/g.51483 Transcript_44769/m.51483 type:complete len:97 (+) Transcript_44769:135-425(+)
MWAQTFSYISEKTILAFSSSSLGFSNGTNQTCSKFPPWGVTQRNPPTVIKYRYLIKKILTFPANDSFIPVREIFTLHQRDSQGGGDFLLNHFEQAG